jgi:type IV secretion system protein VirD4
LLGDQSERQTGHFFKAKPPSPFTEPERGRNTNGVIDGNHCFHERRQPQNARPGALTPGRGYGKRFSRAGLHPAIWSRFRSALIAGEEIGDVFMGSSTDHMNTTKAHAEWAVAHGFWNKTQKCALHILSLYIFNIKFIIVDCISGVHPSRDATGGTMIFDDLPRGLPGSHEATGTAPRALWMHPAVLQDSDFWTYQTGKIFLGTSGGRRIGIKDNRHLLTIAGSRAGKGVSAILPNLLLYPGSVLVIDPKGENATESAERRGKGRRLADGGMGHDVFVIDPFKTAKVADEYRAGFNPLADLDPASDDFIDECDAIADALVVAEPGKENDHWNASTRLVLRGYIAWVAASPDVKTRDLNEVRRLLFLPSGGDGEVGPFEMQLAGMIHPPEETEPPIAHGVPHEAASALSSMSDRERSGVLSHIRQHIAFLASPPMAATLTGGSRSPNLTDWKNGKTSVYLCLPAARLHRHFRFFRLFINRLLGAIEQDKKVPETPALMILDEMHVLGHMKALETAAGLVAGYGVRLWSIWQDLAQLKHIYGDRWETFLGNASIFQTFGLNDLTSLKYVSDRLGTSSMLSISRGEISMSQAAGGFSGESKSIQSSPLLTPDEIAYYFSRQSDHQLIIYPGADPIFLDRLPYFDPSFNNVRPSR